MFVIWIKKVLFFFSELYFGSGRGDFESVVGLLRVILDSIPAVSKTIWSLYGHFPPATGSGKLASGIFI